MGAALELLIDRVDKNIKKTTADAKGDWRPMLFVMTDGSPSDLHAFKEAAAEIKKRNFGNIIACAAGPKAKQEHLRHLTDHVVMLDTMSTASFSGFFKWVSASVAAGSSSAGVTSPTSLPPPPPEVQVVI